MAIPERRDCVKYTYKDYLNWPDAERWELIDGIPYDMSPAPTRKHQKISGELFAAIHNYLKGKTCEVYSAPFDVRLIIDNEEDEEITNVVQPDISVICDISKLDDRGCKGSPDLIIEIVAPSTLKKDLKEKFYLYEKARVKEYWIVYPDEKTIVLYRLNNTNKYGRPEVYSEEDTIKVGIFEALEINLNDIFSH
ncbi:Uma2 family endonuclease [Clostridium thermarum]|uniref:Uma2 family endonuclease n=1 Tax=Clostridium thermarum TaxID=1716543 RepID=UPI00111D8835|nr:Uma2 family endonuclease [Clostridium thermarum]